jgi:hypothetical protein
MSKTLGRTRATLRLAAFTIGAIALSGSAVSAQDQPTAALAGLVFDSTAMSPLAGARVAVMGTSALGTTDEGGRFLLRDVPEGEYWVSFFHPRLQELGVSAPPRQVNLRGGVTSNAMLAVPSEETLLMGWCLAEQPAAGSAAVAGFVTDSITGVPMPRAIVTAEPISRLPGLRPVEVRTDDSGYFRICSVRGDVDIKLQAEFGASAGRTVEVYVPAGTARLQDLVLLMSAEGTLSGFVRDYITEQAVSGAEVSVAGTGSSTLTDITGRFILDDLPPGRHLVTTDHLAFEQRTDSVTIFSEETVDIEVRMATEALEVEGLVVTARSRFGRTSLAGDAKRADFLSREEIDVLLPRVAATEDLLRNMNTPGLRIRNVYQVDQITGVMVPTLCIEVSRRSGGEGCTPAAVTLNDVLIPYPDQFLQDLDPNIIDRIEILSPIDAQFQYGSAAGNGAVAIYTR